MQNAKFKIKKFLQATSYELKANGRGQSLIELVVALGIFAIVGSALVFLIFNSYIAGRLASEITIANFLAEEGLEATRSVRDNNWTGLVDGDHGLIVSGGTWQFSGISETIDGKFTRVITVETIDPDRKKIISQVIWQFTGARPQEINLVTYLTNWAGEAFPFVAQLHYRWRNDDGGE